jgi:transcriptional regulator with XRE-family HTH domain
MSPLTSSRFKPLPGREVAICHRLGMMRRFCRMAQAKFASRLGITRSELANLESARVPLKFWTGWKACLRCDVNQRWLATGLDPVRSFIEFPGRVWKAVGFVERRLFSDVCSTILKAFLDRETGRQITQNLSAATSRARAAGAVVADMQGRPIMPKDCLNMAESRFQCLKQKWVGDLPPDLLGDFLDELSNAGEAILQRLQMRLGLPKNCALDTLRESVNIPGVIPRLPQTYDELVDCLTSLTKRPAKKSDLADFLRTRPQRLSEWLHGRHQPGADVTLRMLQWVQKMEEEQKGPGRATTRPRRRTQLERKQHAKPKKSGPP